MSFYMGVLVIHHTRGNFKLVPSNLWLTTVCVVATFGQNPMDGDLRDPPRGFFVAFVPHRCVLEITDAPLLRAIVPSVLPVVSNIEPSPSGLSTSCLFFSGSQGIYENH